MSVACAPGVLHRSPAIGASSASCRRVACAVAPSPCLLAARSCGRRRRRRRALTDEEQAYADACADDFATPTDGLGVTDDAGRLHRRRRHGELGVEPFEEADVEADVTVERTRRPVSCSATASSPTSRPRRSSTAWRGCADLSARSRRRRELDRRTQVPRRAVATARGADLVRAGYVASFTTDEDTAPDDVLRTCSRS